MSFSQRQQSSTQVIISLSLSLYNSFTSEHEGIDHVFHVVQKCFFFCVSHDFASRGLLDHILLKFIIILLQVEMSMIFSQDKTQHTIMVLLPWPYDSVYIKLLHKDSWFHLISSPQSSQSLYLPSRAFQPIVLWPTMVMQFTQVHSTELRRETQLSSPSAKGFTPLTFISLFTCFTYNHDNYLVLGSNSRIYNKERSHSIQTMHYYFSIWVQAR